MKPMNDLLADIVVASGGAVTSNTRNGLLGDWLDAVSSPSISPTITLNPASQSVDEYGNVTFTGAATGDEPITYQWYKNGSPVGTNSTSYTLTAAAADNGATVYFTATNASGSATSSAAALGVTRTSVRFNGSTQYANIPDVQYDFNSLTVDITAKVESVSFPQVIYWGGNYDWYISVRSSTSIRLAWYASPSERFVDVTLPTSVGERVIKAEFMGAGGMRLTVDGISASNSDVVSPSLKGTTTQIGKRDYGIYFSGIIRRVVISQASAVIRDYRMNDGFAANPVCKDYASGSDGQYVDITSSSWSSS